MKHQTECVPGAAVPQLTLPRPTFGHAYCRGFSEPSQRVGRGCGRRLAMGSGRVCARRASRGVRGLPPLLYLSRYRKLPFFCHESAWWVGSDHLCTRPLRRGWHDFTASHTVAPTSGIGVDRGPARVAANGRRTAVARAAGGRGGHRRRRRRRRATSGGGGPPHLHKRRPACVGPARVQRGAAAATNGRRCVGSARTDGYTDDTRAAQRPVRATSSVGSGRGVGRGFVWLQSVLARRSVWRSPRCAGAGGGAG